MTRSISLAASNPFGPIFGKELRVMSRRRRSYALRVVYLGVLLLFLLLAWTSTATYGTGASAAVQRQNDLGRTFFAFFAGFSVAAMGLIGPVLTATAINGERAGKTLNVLLMTPITATQIVLGKLLSRMLAALTLVGLSLPALAVVRLLGGVELEQMVGAICIIAATALVGASLGLLLSVVVQRAWAVILLSYLGLLVLWLAVPAIIGLATVTFSNGPSRGPVVWVLQTMVSISPPINIGMVLSGSVAMSQYSWWPGVAGSVGLSAVFLLLAILLVKRTVRREGEPAAKEIKLAEAQAADPGPVAGSQRKSNREVGDNPILWRELRQPLMQRGWRSVVSAIAVLGLLVAFYFLIQGASGGMFYGETHIGFAFVFHGLFWLLAAVLGATSVASEKEGDTWEMLIATPLDGRTIVWGKFLGILRRLFWPAVLIAGHFALFAVLPRSLGRRWNGETGAVLSVPSAFLTVAVLLTSNLVWVATGMWLSVKLKKVTTAVVLNLALAISLYGLIPLVLGVLDVLVRASGDLVGLTMWYLPFMYEGAAIDALSGRSGTNTLRWAWPLGQIDTSTFAWLAVAFCIVHLALTALILRLTAGRFDAMVGRAKSGGRMSDAGFSEAGANLRPTGSISL